MSARNQRGSRPQDPGSRRNLRKGSRRAPLWDSRAAGPGVDAAGARPPGLCAGGAHLLVSARGLRGRHRIWQTFEGLLGCSVGSETDGCHLCALSLPFSSPKVTFFLSFSSVFPAITTNSLRFAPASVHYLFFFFFFPLLARPRHQLYTLLLPLSSWWVRPPSATLQLRTSISGSGDSISLSCPSFTFCARFLWLLPYSTGIKVKGWRKESFWGT